MSFLDSSSTLYTLSFSNYGRIYQDKSFIEISDECREIVEILEPQKLNMIKILTNYILVLKMKFLKKIVYKELIYPYLEEIP